MPAEAVSVKVAVDSAEEEVKENDQTQAQEVSSGNERGILGTRTFSQRKEGYGDSSEESIEQEEENSYRIWTGNENDLLVTGLLTVGLSYSKLCEIITTRSRKAIIQHTYNVRAGHSQAPQGLLDVIRDLTFRHKDLW